MEHRQLSSVRYADFLYDEKNVTTNYFEKTNSEKQRKNVIGSVWKVQIGDAVKNYHVKESSIWWIPI